MIRLSPFFIRQRNLSPILPLTMSSSPSDKLIEVAKLFEGLYNQVESVLGPDLPSHSPIDHLAHIPPLILPIPEPHSLISKLSAAGASSALASDVSSIHAARAQDLASQYLDVYNKTCHEISRAYQPPFYERATSLFLRLQKIRALYDASLRRWEVEYVDLVKKRIGNRLPPKESFNRVRLLFISSLTSSYQLFRTSPLIWSYISRKTCFHHLQIDVRSPRCLECPITKSQLG